MIELLTSGDLEYNRMIVVYLNGQADPALTDHSRPHYAIISTLVDQCKSEGSITINMDTVRLTEFLIMLVNGMETDYLMGDKTTLETNKARLSWFLDTLQV